jgi:hypothetical protein
MLALGGAGLCFALAAARPQAGWARRGGSAAYLDAIVNVLRSGATGPWRAVPRAELPALVAASGTSGPARQTRAIARGIVLATPLVVVFGALLATADAVFARLVVEELHLDPGTLVSHVLLTAVLGWVAVGYLSGSLTPREQGAEAGARPLLLGITEVGVVLGVLNVLFLSFVLIQLRYLFGGAALVEVTPGLTYADYARQGFFELVLVAALVIPLLLAADAVLERRRRAHEIAFRVLAGGQVVLLLAITASAFERMRLYQSAYGLTEQRLYVTAVLALVAFVLVWFAGTVLRGRREHFAFGACSAALLTIAALHVANPDALIARTNLTRQLAAATAGTPGERSFDAQYALLLSADAVPVLLPALPSLPAQPRCLLVARLLNRWWYVAPIPVRSWNRSAARARQLVDEDAAALRAYAAAAECAPEGARTGPT